MKALKGFVRIIDYQTFIIATLSVLSTYVSKKFSLAADMPTGLIGIAIIFPIVFSINSAYKRREEALSYFASLKAHALSLFYAHRDWCPSNKDSTHEQRAKSLVEALLKNVQKFFVSSEKESKKNLLKVHTVFSSFSRSHEILREQGVPANEISRVNQYLRAMILDFERMKNIYDYRTPVSLRTYSQIFLNSFPILFGPYFAYLAQKSFPLIGYIVAVLYSLVLVSLDNIQEDLENPFDAIGEDDVNLDVAEEYKRIMDME